MNEDHNQRWMSKTGFSQLKEDDDEKLCSRSWHEWSVPSMNIASSAGHRTPTPRAGDYKANIQTKPQSPKTIDSTLFPAFEPASTGWLRRTDTPCSHFVGIAERDVLDEIESPDET